MKRFPVHPGVCRTGPDAPSKTGASMDIEVEAVMSQRL